MCPQGVPRIGGKDVYPGQGTEALLDQIGKGKLPSSLFTKASGTVAVAPVTEVSLEVSAIPPEQAKNEQTS